MFSRLPVWAPSPVPDPLFREVPKAVSTDEIAEIVESYALVADHCREGGFDGIELQCSHSSIVRGFLSPATNRRTDDYGGSLENRARILVEIVAALQSAGFTIGTVTGNPALAFQGLNVNGKPAVQGSVWPRGSRVDLFFAAA